MSNINKQHNEDDKRLNALRLLKEWMDTLETERIEEVRKNVKNK